ncbi:MAG: nuclear transport factor 2 family protein [Burkholderiales bacterium]|nr:nuclear transport factor 2 family protein [Burkholderiales bacterium]
MYLPAGQVPEALRRYIEGLQKHDVDQIATTVSDDLAFVAATRTLDKPTFLAMLRALYTGFPDWRYDHPGVELHEGGIYAVKWRQEGAHLGTWNLAGMEPIAPTGRQVRIAAHYFFYTLRNGLIVTIRPDPVPGGAPRGILEQIGMDTPPL